MNILKENKSSKPKIPKFVVDYYNSIGRPGFLNMIDKLQYIVRGSIEAKVRKWLENSQNQLAFLIYINLGEDYIEIEKEQKYYVVDKQNRPLLGKDNRGKIEEVKVKRQIKELMYLNYLETYQLTKKEIKDYDSRYWSFAKEIEEFK